MDCQYIRQNDVHERYLLNRLTQAEKAEYEKHIGECWLCRQELEEQKRVIAGIRTVGRMEMKKAIRMRVEEIRAQQKSANWQMIFKVAAVVFIFALIPGAIYFFQTDSGESLSELPRAERLEAEEDYVVQERHSGEQSDQTSPPSQPTQRRLERAPAPETPAAEMAVSELHSTADSPDVSMRRRITSAGAMGETAPDLIHEEELPDTQSADAQSLPLLAGMDRDEFDQVLAGGVRYQFVSDLHQKPAQTGRQEIPTLQKYDAMPPREFAPDSRTEERDVSPMGFPSVSGVVFEGEGKTIVVNYHPSEQQLALEGDTNLPQSFEVEIVHRDSPDLRLIWKVNPGFLDYEPVQMEIVVKDRIMYLIIADRSIYRIDLSSDTTRAVLVRNER